MKLDFVEFCGFRGFLDCTRFEFPSGFAVLTGRNGTGKSTIFDAIEYALTGTISKYAVKGAKGGGLADHIWWIGSGEPASRYVTIGFVGDDGQEISITRSRDKGLETPLEVAARSLCTESRRPDSWEEVLVQTSLIRDETIASLSMDLPEQARFSAVRTAVGVAETSGMSARAEAIMAAATGAKETQGLRVDGTRKELGRNLEALTEARSAADRASDVTSAKRTLSDHIPGLAESERDRAAEVREYIAANRQAIEATSAAIDRLEGLGVGSDDSGDGLAVPAPEEMIKLVDSAEIANKGAQATLVAAQETVVKSTAVDEMNSQLMALTAAGKALGLHNGHCPLCDAERTGSELAAGIAKARARLSEAGEAVSRSLAVLEKARAEAQRTEAALARAKDELKAAKARKDVVDKAISETAALYSKHGIKATPQDTKGARRALLVLKDKIADIEHALLVVEASGAHERIANLEAKISKLRERVEAEEADLAEAEHRLALARRIASTAREIPNQILTEQFDTVMPVLKDLYRRLRPHADWNEIEVDFGGRVRSSLNFSVGEGYNPQFLFSSGQRRAAGIAFLLAIHLSRTWCKFRTLLLDDPVQHVDDYRALNVVEVLSAIRQSGRQVIVSAEDPALAALLCRRLRSTRHEGGRCFELEIASNGSARMAEARDIVPYREEVLGVVNG